MKPILALLVTILTISIWHVTSSQKTAEYSLLYHTKRLSFGCDNAELTAHLLLLRHNNEATFTHTLKELIDNKECKIISPSQAWYKKEHYYNTTILQPINWRDHHHAHPQTIPSSDLAEPTKIPNNSALPGDFLLFIAFLIWLLYGIHALYQKHKSWKFILEHLHYHREKLAQKRLQLVHYDSYGVIHYDKWYKEINFFCTSYLLPNLKKKNLHHPWGKLEKRTKELIHEWASLSATSQRVFIPPHLEQKSDFPKRNLYFSKNMNPLDYEKLCAQYLEQAGWETYLTPASSDQGADIIAIRNGVRLVVQCKLYSRPVGNRAVQEIFTAKEHQKAQIAAVASNARYTRQAHQLAASTGVYLLHHKQLARFTEKTPIIHPISQ